MNKYLIFLLIFTNIVIFACSRFKNYEIINKNTIEIETKNEKDNILELLGNYKNGNGTIIEIKNDESIVWIFRKHIQRREFPVWFDDFTDLIVYEEPVIENPIVITTLKNKNFNILQIAEARTEDNDYYWIKIQTDNNIIGWIFCGLHEYRSAQFRIPYFNNNWEIIDSIAVSEILWTIRKMPKQSIVVFGKINIYDKPGLIGTKIITQTIPADNEIFLNVLAITDEVDTIIEGRDTEFGRKTDRWVKIDYNGIEGWIFGGYATVNRGGPLFWTPENIIDWEIAVLIDGI